MYRKYLSGQGPTVTIPWEVGRAMEDALSLSKAIEILKLACGKAGFTMATLMYIAKRVRDMEYKSHSGSYFIDFKAREGDV